MKSFFQKMCLFCLFLSLMWMLSPYFEYSVRVTAARANILYIYILYRVDIE